MLVVALSSDDMNVKCPLLLCHFLQMRASTMMLKMFDFQEELSDHLGDAAHPIGSAGRLVAGRDIISEH